MVYSVKYKNRCNVIHSGQSSELKYNLVITQNLNINIIVEIKRNKKDSYRHEILFKTRKKVRERRDSKHEGSR